jgi:membrane associated rhomboid family serine protease
LWLGALRLDTAIWLTFIPERVNAGIGGLDTASLALTPLTGTFVHIGFLHLLLDMVALLAAGRAVENIMGRWELLFLWVIGAYASAGAYYLAAPHSTAPLVGAGGAVAALIGAYAVLLGRNKGKAGRPLSGMALYAAWLAAAWIVLQLAMAFAFEPAPAGSRTQGYAFLLAIMPAVAAAIAGGFVVGLALARPLLRFHYRNA